jgi:hypothetical protein
LTENRIALIHRVIIPGKEYPKEYAILVTDQRSIFIRQPKSRNAFVLRGEMRYGTALVTDTMPKTLEDYEKTNVETLVADSSNITVPHDSITSFIMKAMKPEFRLGDLWVWLTMRRQGEIFQVYNFEIKYHNTDVINFYAVPLGMYVKPRRQTQTRETILREYAESILETYRTVLPSSLVQKKEPMSPA